MFGYYMDAEDVTHLLPPLLNLLDGRHDYPAPYDKDKGAAQNKSMCELKLVLVLLLRFIPKINLNTVTCSASKFLL